MLRQSLIGVFLLLTYSSVFAHGDLHKRIARAIKAIEINPDETSLYLKHGLLYFEHEEYQKSLENFTHCFKNNLQHTCLHYNQARTHYHLERHKKALQHFDNQLIKSKYLAKTHRLKGQILAAMNRYDEASICFEKMIDRSPKKIPEDYIEWASATATLTSSKDLAHAKSILEAGISEFGHLVVFNHKLIDLAIKQTYFQEAIEYQTCLLDRAPRKEHHYYKRAKICHLSGQPRRALSDCLEALLTIQNLKSKHRNLPSTDQLQTRLNDLLLALHQSSHLTHSELHHEE